MNANSSVMLLNITGSVPLSPRFYCLNRSDGSWQSATVPKSKAHISGFGSTLITFSDGRLCKKLFAIYLCNGVWMIYDGEQELPLAGCVAKWVIGNVGRASITLQLPTVNKTIDYWRPWLRHWFENEWAIDDIDIAYHIFQSINNKEVLPRLERALEVANLEFGFKARGSV